LVSISRSYFAVVDFCACWCIGLYSDDLAWDAFAELEFTRSNSAVEWLINPSLTVSAKPLPTGDGSGAMIRNLYNLEDRLFYASLTCQPARSRLLETWSRRIGELADRLQAGFGVRA
jgi:hypothetical protein